MGSATRRVGALPRGDRRDGKADFGSEEALAVAAARTEQAEWRAVPLSGKWSQSPDGHCTRQDGDIRLFAEKVGAGFRVLVLRSRSNMQPDEILFSGGAASASDAMEMADREAERITRTIHTEGGTP